MQWAKSRSLISSDLQWWNLGLRCAFNNLQFIVINMAMMVMMVMMVMTMITMTMMTMMTVMVMEALVGGTVYRCAFITYNGVSDGKLYRDFVESNNATILQGLCIPMHRVSRDTEKFVALC